MAHTTFRFATLGALALAFTPALALAQDHAFPYGPGYGPVIQSYPVLKPNGKPDPKAQQALENYNRLTTAGIGTPKVQLQSNADTGYTWVDVRDDDQLVIDPLNAGIDQRLTQSVLDQVASLRQKLADGGLAIAGANASDAGYLLTVGPDGQVKVELTGSVLSAATDPARLAKAQAKNTAQLDKFDQVVRESMTLAQVEKTLGSPIEHDDRVKIAAEIGEGKTAEQALSDVLNVALTSDQRAQLADSLPGLPGFDAKALTHEGLAQRDAAERAAAETSAAKLLPSWMTLPRS